MITPLPLELCLCALWSALIFISGMICGLLLADRKPPGDGDSSSSNSTTTEEAK